MKRTKKRSAPKMSFTSLKGYELKSVGEVPVILFPKGTKPKIRVSMHADETGKPTRVYEVETFAQADQLAEGMLAEVDSLYCARIWEGAIPCCSVYKAAGIIFVDNSLGQLSRIKAEAAARPEGAHTEISV